MIPRQYRPEHPPPAVVAHRGASADAPEHTLTAYQLAIEAGADGLECDVRLTRDGHLVCVHDRRVDRTSTGQGPVSSHSLPELAALDWGRGQPVLPLEQLCGLVADAGNRVELAIETKHPTRYGGLVERGVVELLARFGWTGTGAGPARVMSFSPLAVRRMSALAPEVPTVFLLRRRHRRWHDGDLPGLARIAGPSLELLRAEPDYVEAAHRRGAQVHVWTVDRAEDVALCRELGVDAVITNQPAAVRRLVHSTGAS